MSRFNISRPILIIIVVILIASIGFMHLTGNVALKGEPKQLVVVKAGMTTDELTEVLFSENLITSPLAFRIQARALRLGDKLKVGEYEIKPGMSNSKIIKMLKEGRVRFLVLTIPEGYTVEQIATKIEKEGFGKAEEIKKLAKDYEPYPYMQTNNPDVIYKAEGFLYPSTYHISFGISESDILRLLVNEFDEQLTPAIRMAITAQNMTIRDAVNMAAMVEKEAVFADEKPLIAGVFRKRLAIGMPIQSDTTIQYILGTQKPEITIADTKIESPYNTYLHQGMPPGPIASPSISTIEAVLNATDTELLYFVADLEGRHHFTKTYEEHLQEIDRIHGPQ